MTEICSQLNLFRRESLTRRDLYSSIIEGMRSTTGPNRKRVLEKLEINFSENLDYSSSQKTEVLDLERHACLVSVIVLKLTKTLQDICS